MPTSWTPRPRRPARYTSRIRVALSAAARGGLETVAAGEDRLMSEIVRRALDDYVAAAEADRAPAAEPLGHPPWETDATVVIRPAVADGLAELAQRHGRSIAGEARAAIDAHLRARGIAADETQARLTPA